MERNIFSNKPSKIKPAIWLVLLGIIGLFLLATWFYLPHVLSENIKKLLIEYGHEDVEIAGFNFQPFSGGISASEIKFATKDQYTVAIKYLSVNLSWLSLMDKHIKINNLFIKEATIRVADITQLPYNNVADVEFVKVMVELFPKQILNSLELDLLEVYKTKIEIINAGIRTNYFVDKMSIRNLLCCDSNAPAKIDFSGQINDTAFSYIGTVSIFDESPTLSGKLSTNGLSLANYSNQFSDWFTTIDGEIYLDSNVDIDINDNNIQIKQSGKLKIQKLFAENQGVHIVEDELNWEGQSDLLISRDFKLLSLTANGRVLSNGFYIMISEHQTNMEFETLNWNGSIDSNISDDGEYDTNTSGDLTIINFSLSGEKNKVALLTAPKLLITGFKSNNLNLIEASDIKISQAAVAQLATNSKADTATPAYTFWKSADVHINNWKLLDLSHLTISNINAQNNKFSMHRREDKTWNPLGTLPLIIRSDSQNQSPQDSSLYIHQVKLSSPNTLYFRDDTVTPPYETSIELSDTDIGELTSVDPDNYVNIQLSGKFDNQAQIIVTGKVQVFSQYNNFQFDAVIRDFPLSSISAYTENNSNYSIINGMLNGKISLQTINNNFKGNTRFFYSDLQVESTKNKKLSGFQRNLGISLSSAINHLNNDKNQFKTLLSIEGNLDDPTFKFYDSYFNVLGKQLLDKSLLRVKKLFRPYNKTVGITPAKNNQPSRITLQPINFTPGNTLLDFKAIEYIDKIRSVLKKHSDIKVDLCGMTARLDRKVFNRVLYGSGPTRGLKKDHIKFAKLYLKSISGRKGQDVNYLLRKLSNDRVLVTTNYLLSQRAVNKDQIKFCKPYIDNRKTSSPRVDLFL